MDVYLTVQELSEKIKFSKQSLYNLIYKKKFTLGVHYLKPTPKKILFVWSEIEKWLQQSTHEPDQCVEAEQPVQNENEQSLNKLNYTTKPTKSKENPPASAIRI